MIGGHTFQKSPLSPGVPLEGSDTVAGLQQIARWTTAERFIETNGLHRGDYLHIIHADVQFSYYCMLCEYSNIAST